VSTATLFPLTVLVDGVLTGALYAPLALAFVVVYRASAMINFALGEWAMLGAALVAAGGAATAPGLAASLGGACLVMIALSLAFNRVVLKPLLGRPIIALVMVTLGLGALVRGASTIAFRGGSGRIAAPIPTEPLAVHGVLVATDKLVAALLAVGAVALTAWFFRRSRTGLALRAVADDQQIAMSMGIDVHRHFAITWAVVGVLAVLAGTLWTLVAAGGLGAVLLGLKVFPIVIVGGLDSISGTFVGAILIGVLESVTAAYLAPSLGGGISTAAAYLVVLAVLLARPHGLFGRPSIARV
jgi:branched-chain amino acid transport system permease protein